jgi:hypothetical protein
MDVPGRWQGIYFLQKCEYYSPLSHQRFKQDPIELERTIIALYTLEAAKSP